MSLQRKSGQLIRIVRCGSGRRTRTSDLRVMSPTSYQLLHPAIYLPCPLPLPTAFQSNRFQTDRPHRGGALYRFCVCKDKSNFSFLQIKIRPKPVSTVHINLFISRLRQKNYFRAPATISARSRTSPFVPRPMAFLQSGQAVTITSAPVASSSPATARAICTC